MAGAGSVAALLVAWTVAAQVIVPIEVRMVTIGSSTFLPVVSESLNIEIDGQHARTQLNQVFHNPAGTNVEGRYTLWAGPGARADGFAYWNGEQKIVGEVFEKETARQVYLRVTSRRRDPGLLEEKRDGEFTFVVSPIQPNEDKRVEVVYSRWLSRRSGIIEVDAPMARRDSEVTVTILDDRVLKNFTSSTHEIEVKKLGSGKMLVRSKDARPGSKQFSLRYEVAERPWSVTAYAHRNRGEDAYFALTLATPPNAKRETPKDVTLVIDRSGSMSGTKLKQAREACLNIVQRLSSKDRVNVMLFDDRLEKLFRTPEPVTEKNRKKAEEYLELMHSGGGTDLAGALEAALKAQEEGARPRVVLFFTDGQSASDPVLAVANQDKRDVRVFTIGLGKDINRPLLSRLASIKRGRFTYIPVATNIEREVALLYNQIEAPQLIDIFLETENGVVSTMYPRTLPDLFNDDELLITGRLRGKGTVEFIVKAMNDGKSVAYRTEIALDDQLKRPWVGRLWAKSRIDDLLEEIKLKGANPELVNEVTELGLAYNYVTPYTSFLAIPASEVDAVSAHQLASARAAKQEVMRRKSDAARLSESEAGEGSDGKEIAAQDSAARSPTPVVAADRDDQAMVKSMSARESDNAPLSEIRRQQETDAMGAKKGGCASCDLGGRDQSNLSGMGLLLAALILLRRRGSKQTD